MGLECLFDILLFCNVQTVANSMMMCKYIASINKQYFWKKLYNRDYSNNFIEGDNYAYKYKVEYSFMALKRKRYTMIKYDGFFGDYADIQYIYATKSVKFFNNGIKKMPYQIINLNFLEKLSIIDNNFTEIPKELAHLPNLTELSMEYNRIKHVDNINAIINLRKLNLNFNRIKSISPAIFKLEKLYTLHLCSNKITDIDNIYNITSLVELHISDNQIHILSNKIHNLANLKILDLGNNLIKDIPKNIQYLFNLETLFINNNHIRRITNKLCSLYKLKKLNISNNLLVGLPKHFYLLVNLEDLIMNGNKQICIEPNIKKLYNIQTLSIGQKSLDYIGDMLLYTLYNMLSITLIKIECNSGIFINKYIRRPQHIALILLFSGEFYNEQNVSRAFREYAVTCVEHN